MPDKTAYHLPDKMPMQAFSVKAVLAALLSISVFAQPANAAEQEWWFDVEVILFKRNLDTASISEKFEQSRLKPPTGDYVDILTPYLTPDLSYLRAGLPYCRASKRLAVQAQYEQDFAFPLPKDRPNESATPQTNELSEKNQQVDQSSALQSDEVAEENFQYEVATTDIFAQPDNTNNLDQATDAEGTNSSNSEQSASDNVQQQSNAEFAVKPPVQVEFIEWQIPSEFLCAYSEQIDPSFASILPLQSDELGQQPSNHINHVPEVINGTEWQQKRSAFLLPKSKMLMRDLYDKIVRQRDITPILHLNWRQEVKFGREKGQTIRLFAGQNFAQQFDANGIAIVKNTDSLFASLNQPVDEFYIPEQELASLTAEQQRALLAQHNSKGADVNTEDLFARIAAALADNTPIKIDPTESQTEQQTAKTGSAVLKELWQLDGGITVYLRNVGRIPYLHIDSNLDFRQPVFDPKKAPQIEDRLNNLSEQGAVAVNQLQQSESLQPNSLQPTPLQPNYLQSVNFDQLRRVISKQVHYFDHPLFGMIVRINRYRWPEIPSDENESN